MEFEWDERKSLRCLEKRGFDFSYSVRAFYDPDRQIHEDTRFDYGETRYQLTGQIEGRHFIVVFTFRQDVIRIISARKANTREVKDYENHTHQG